MLTVAGGIVLAVFILAAVPFLLRGVAVVLAIGLAILLFLLCVGHSPETTAALVVAGLLLGGWRLKHLQNKTAEREAQEQAAENERRHQKGLAPLGVIPALAPSKSLIPGQSL